MGKIKRNRNSLILHAFEVLTILFLLVRGIDVDVCDVLDPSLVRRRVVVVRDPGGPSVPGRRRMVSLVERWFAGFLVSSAYRGPVAVIAAHGFGVPLRVTSVVVVG